MQLSGFDCIIHEHEVKEKEITSSVIGLLEKSKQGQVTSSPALLALFSSSETQGSRERPRPKPHRASRSNPSDICS